MTTALQSSNSSTNALHFLSNPMLRLAPPKEHREATNLVRDRYFRVNMRARLIIHKITRPPLPIDGPHIPSKMDEQPDNYFLHESQCWCSAVWPSAQMHNMKENQQALSCFLEVENVSKKSCTSSQSLCITMNSGSSLNSSPS